MHGAGITVKEAWVKAKVVYRKKAVQMMSSPIPPPPPPPPHFPTRSFDSALATETDKGVASLVNRQFWLTRSACFLLTRLMEQHESMGKGILIPADVTDVHKMLRFARSKPDWCTELEKPFTMAG